MQTPENAIFLYSATRKESGSKRCGTVWHGASSARWCQSDKEYERLPSVRQREGCVPRARYDLAERRKNACPFGRRVQRQPWWCLAEALFTSRVRVSCSRNQGRFGKTYDPVVPLSIDRAGMLSLDVLRIACFCLLFRKRVVC